MVFDAAQVFDTLYAGPSWAAFERTKGLRAGDVLESEKMLGLLKETVVALFPKNRPEAGDVGVLHRRYLRRMKGRWRTVYSARPCFCCLIHSQPEHRLSCGHRLCRTCVQTREPDPNSYSVPQCPLCVQETGRFPIGLVPDWAGLRVLSLDGGGCRGIIHLIALAALERVLPVPEIGIRWVDLVIGISIGKFVSFPGGTRPRSRSWMTISAFFAA
jgi:hypothetical protein